MQADAADGGSVDRMMLQLELMIRIEDEALLARAADLDLLAYRACQLADNLVELARRAGPSAPEPSTPAGPPNTAQPLPIGTIEAA